MFEKDPNQGKPYPATEEEGKKLVANIIKFLHSDKVRKSLVTTLKEGQDQPIETIARLGAMATMQAIKSLEKSVKRDIPSQTELGALSMIVEELATMATQMGFKATPEMVQEMIQIGSNLYNQMLEKMEGGGPPEGPPPQGALQGPPQGAPPQGRMMPQQGPPQTQGGMR